MDERSPLEIWPLLSWVFLDGYDAAPTSRLACRNTNHTPLIITTHVYIHKTATCTLSELLAAFLIIQGMDGGAKGQGYWGAEGERTRDGAASDAKTHQHPT